MTNRIFAALLAALALGVPSPGFAKHTPQKPPMQSSARHTGSQLVSGAASFDCGTYKGNEAENVLKMELHKGFAGRNEALRTVTTPPPSYIYDDVWVVEDDGSLTISGVNLFDTDNATFHFEPSGDTFEISEIAHNFADTLGTEIFPGDDGEVLIVPMFSFSFAGSNWAQFYVGGNGLISFGAVPNPSGFYDNADFLNTTPKITPYFLDLDPSDLGSGGVYVRSQATKCTITWDAVVDWGTTDDNTVQLVLYDDGSFDISFNGITSTTQDNGAPIYLGFNPGAGAPNERISFSGDLPYTSGPDAAVYEDYLNLANPIVDEVALFQLFYSQFPDDFFQLVFFTNFFQTMSGFANELNIMNDVAGIGLGIFDTSNQYGSNSVLESRCNMNRLAVWSSDPTARIHGKGNNFLTIMAQEAGHRWGAFMNFEDSTGAISNLILGRADAHWSYFVDNDHGGLEGGNWSLLNGNTYTSPTQIDHFSHIDEYTFGLRTPEEVKDIYYIGGGSNDLLSNRDNGTPLIGANVSGTFVPVTIDDIIAAEGARSPDEPGQNKDLRQAFILLLAANTQATQPELDKISGHRRAWEDYFEVACDGRLNCSTSITMDLPVGVIEGLACNKLTDEVIQEITVRSLERGFDQTVPAGGRYFFRYQADSLAIVGEPVTLVFEADGYFPDTLVTAINYGDSTHFGCMENQLTPVPSSVPPGVVIPNALYPNYPNPFNPTTIIRYDLRADVHVRVSVYDVAGREVRRLVDRRQAAGHQNATWDGVDDNGNLVPSGVYFYKLDLGDYVRTRKMVLLK